MPRREIVTLAVADNDRLGERLLQFEVLTITARSGQVYTFEFRTSEKAHAVHTMILERVLE